MSIERIKNMNLEICNEQLRQNIWFNLKNFDSITHNRAGMRQAAVAVTIVDVSSHPGLSEIQNGPIQRDAAALILTKRAVSLKNHSGQWAFPGGKIEEGESPEEAALRELAEEVGLELSQENIIGRLDDFTTRSGFTIKPVVVWGGQGMNLVPNPAEVQSIHRIPIEEFLRDDSPIIHETSNSKTPILLMPIGDSWIAAPTAAIIYQFREVAILGNDTRVAHYEQPAFAWK